jgi:hypothetical protein
MSPFGSITTLKLQKYPSFFARATDAYNRNQEVRKMARSERQERPVSDEEVESMPEHISSHFDRVRDLMEQETDDSDA